MRKSSKRLVLGSAMWGWSVGEGDASDLISTFTERGGVWIDTAVNYPINKRPADFGKAIRFISNWLSRAQRDGVAILVKVGAKENTGSDRADLTPDGVWSEVRRLRGLFGETLRNVSIHWDNRGEEDRVRIRETLSVFRSLHSEGLEIGFSGVRNPILFCEEAPDLSDKWWIQVKENLITTEARERYSSLLPEARYIAYGINMGGFSFGSRSSGSSAALRGLEYSSDVVEEIQEKIKLAQGLVPAPTTLHEFTLLHAYKAEGLAGVIVGPSKASQLRGAMDYWALLEEVNGSGVRG